MGEIETLGILDEIQVLVSDKLQVVTYKWLSRNFLVSSNAAKRLLEEFVEKHGSGLEVVYSLSGWLKNNPSTYHIMLVSRTKLAEAKKDFNDDCSVQVYSVQACMPKDPATLWNAEFVQAEELFMQSLVVDNCLLDNRFCGVSNSFVKRNAGGTPISIIAPQIKGAGGLGLSKSPPNLNATLPQQKRVQKPSPSTSLQSSSLIKDVKSESHVAGGPDSKPVIENGKVPQPHVDKKGQSDNNSSRSGALANMWGRASAKSKPDCAPAETNNATVNSSEAQMCAREAVEDGSSDDDGEDVNVRRKSNGEGGRKRRVVFDFSDDEDEYKDAVNLASPDPPKKQSDLSSKQSFSTLSLERNKLDLEDEIEDKPVTSGGEAVNMNTNPVVSEESFLAASNIKATDLSSEKSLNYVSNNDVHRMDKASADASTSPKRRKVVKKRIDERGREVTEVVWEGEETEEKSNSNTTKKADNVTLDNAIHRVPAKKSPALGTNAPHQAGKAGNKKGGHKDPKQGNILSFFKKV